MGMEERVLEEREEAYSKLLVQLGQDMAISQEHGKLLARQRDTIQHLREVYIYMYTSYCPTYNVYAMYVYT